MKSGTQTFTNSRQSLLILSIGTTADVYAYFEDLFTCRVDGKQGGNLLSFDACKMLKAALFNVTVRGVGKPLRLDRIAGSEEENWTRTFTR
jgi:hypothetical protein